MCQLQAIRLQHERQKGGRREHEAGHGIGHKEHHLIVLKQLRQRYTLGHHRGPSVYNGATCHARSHMRDTLKTHSQSGGPRASLL